MPNLPQKVGPYKKLQKLCDSINGLIDYCASLKPLPSLNCYTNHTSVGVRRQPIADEATTVPGGGMNFRGEWRPQAYSEQDVVVVRGGTAAGTYVALQDVPANQPPAYPDLGIYWASMGRDFAGIWS